MNNILLKNKYLVMFVSLFTFFSPKSDACLQNESPEDAVLSSSHQDHLKSCPEQLRKGQAFYEEKDYVRAALNFKRVAQSIHHADAYDDMELASEEAVAGLLDCADYFVSVKSNPYQFNALRLYAYEYYAFVKNLDKGVLPSQLGRALLGEVLTLDPLTQTNLLSNIVDDNLQKIIDMGDGVRAPERSQALMLLFERENRKPIVDMTKARTLLQQIVNMGEHARKIDFLVANCYISNIGSDVTHGSSLQDANLQ